MTLGHEKRDVLCLSIGDCMEEKSEVYGFKGFDFNPDSDIDPEETKSRQADALDAPSSCQ